MKRLTVPLLLATLAMQVAIFYNQLYSTKAGPKTAVAVRDAPDTAVVEIHNRPVRGSSDSKAILVEFSDYECPFCQRHSATVAKEINEKYVTTGRLRHVFINNPLSSHPQARFLAKVGICGGEQGQYWETSDALFRGKPKSQADVELLLHSLPIDSRLFQKCLESPTLNELLDEDIRTSGQLGLSGTPSFGLGFAGADGRVHLKKIVSGAQPFEVFERAINEILSTGA
jgi:protein-disulfide isomerase